MTADAPVLDSSVVIPAHNEAQRLPGTLQALRAFLAGRPWRVEVVVVDDGRSERTAEAAAEGWARLPVRVIVLTGNLGKGAAVRRGIAETRGACVGFVDADLRC